MPKLYIINDRVYLPKRSAENFHLRLATRTQAPAMVMVWTAITAEGCSTLVFIDRGVKINVECYRKNMLEGALQPGARKHFGHRPWTLQQDSAPSHSARAIQEWLKMRFLASFPAHNGHQNLRMMIRWTIVPGVFWKARIPECRSTQESASPPMAQNTAEPFSGSV